VRAARLVSFAGIIAAGLLLALPFRQYSPASGQTPPDEEPLALPLRQPDFLSEASAPGDVSPAVGLVASNPPMLQPGPPLHEASYFVPLRPDLEQLAPPPDLPVEFEPAQLPKPPASAAGAWRPPRRTFATKDRQPRNYRLRDGDTLESLAQRFLGSAARAEEIYALNRQALSTPDLLPIGTTIVIPPKSVGDESTP
jgi:nucleoid-associated protein YgaU